MEANDMKAMREALMTIRKRLVAAYVSESEFMRQSSDKPLVDLIDAALSKPPRQCDVGTAEEQAKRFNDFCTMKGCRFGGDKANKCPLDPDACEFAWAQMPYEKEDGDGDNGDSDE